MRSTRPGFSLVELLVALVLLSVAMIALAGTAAVAHHSFAAAAARERVVRAAAHVIDSLAHVEHPGAGRRTSDRVQVDWIIVRDLHVLRTEVSVLDERTGTAAVFTGDRPAPAEQAGMP